MEHRRDIRIQTPVKLVVHADDGTTQSGLTRNISRGGAVIVAERLKTIENKKIVWVEFIEGEVIVKVPAYVLRCTERTAAVMFITHPRAFQFYLNYLIWNANVH